MSPSNWLRRLYALAGASIFTLLLGLIMIQERLIFFPEKLAEDHVFDFKKSVEKKFSFENLKISTLYFPEDSSKSVILYFHGNAGSLRNWGAVGEELRAHLKQSVWVLDYPGYGKSEGTITSERQLLDLADAFYSKAVEEFSGKKIIVYGRSIGSGPAAWLAAKYKLPLILETPYTSFSKLASELAPWFPSFLRRYSFETDKWLKGFAEPLLLIHGTHDEVIPSHHSQNLQRALAGATYAEIPMGNHNNLSDFEEYWVALTKFFGNKMFL